MTEREAIEILYEKHNDLEYYYAENDCYPKGYDDDFVNALDIMFGILKEVKLYRSIGTIEELQKLKNK